MSIKENIAAIEKALPVEFVKSLKATNANIASERTVRFDVPTEQKDTVKRVKVTKTSDGFTVKLYRVELTDQIDMIKPEGLQSVIKAMLTGELPDVDLSKYGKAAE